MLTLNSENKFVSKFQNYFWVTFSSALIIIDQLIKLAVLKLGWSIFLNDKFAFSLPIPTFLIFLIYFLVLISIGHFIYHAWNRFSTQQKFAWCLVLAGGLSNIAERIVTGHVVDFIYLATGVFNVADFYILLGLVLLLASNRSSKKQENI